jgi:hypothetical protein
MLSLACEGFAESNQVGDAGVDRRRNPVPGADSDNRAIEEVDLGPPAASEVLEHRG